jgi:signal transduction histidine kinase
VTAGRYRALFDAAPTGLVVTDANLTVLEANLAAGVLLELEPRDLVGKPLAVFVDTRDRRELRALPRHLTDGSATRTLNLRMRRRTHVAFDARVTVTRGSGELYWAILDRTDEVFAEARLWELNRELEERVGETSAELETLARQLPVGVAVLTASGEVAWMNERAVSILGGPGLVSTRLAVLAARALGGEIVRDARLTAEHPAGERTLEATAAAITSRRGGVVIVLDDVTERDRVERSEAEFVENAAHQLRNPIAAISSSVAALEAGAKDDEVERDRFIAHVGRESARMGHLVDALLTLAAAQQGGNVRTLVEVAPLKLLIDGALATTKLHNGVRAVVTCNPDVAVVGDRELIVEAIRNVIANAAEHTRDGEIRIRADLHDETVTLDVSDDGPGVPEDARGQVFDRFYRAPVHGRGGSGLGLAIARAAAEASRSRLELLDNGAGDGDGATFRFTMRGARML